MTGKYTVKHQKKFPEKHNAVNRVYRLRKKGLIKPPERCERCAMPKTGLQAHHEDYSKPDEIVWLCPKCHKARHKEMRQERCSTAG